MKKLLLFIFLFTSHAYALEYEYKSEKKISYNHKIYLYTKILKSLSFDPQFNSYFGELPILKVDQVYEKLNSSTQIFLKVGLTVKNEDRNKIIQVNNFYLYHFDDAAFAFFNTDYKSVEIIVNKISEYQKEISSLNFSKFTTMSLYAATCDNQLIKGEVNQLSKTAEAISLFEYSKEFSSCALDQLKENLNFSMDSESFFKKFSLNPAELWESVKKQYEGMKEISNLFSKEFSHFLQNIALSFTPAQKMQMTCLMGKEIGPSLPTMFIGAGAGVAFIKIFSSILPKFQKLLDTLIKLKSLPQSDKLISKGLSCAI